MLQLKEIVPLKAMVPMKARSEAVASEVVGDIGGPVEGQGASGGVSVLESLQIQVRQTASCLSARSCLSSSASLP